MTATHSDEHPASRPFVPSTAAPSTPAASTPAPSTPVPSTPLLHFAMMLTGLATALLGPILPLLSRHWQLQDQQSGLLLLAQFCGSFTGGLTVQRHLRRSIVFGLAAGCAGFLLFAVSPSLPFACAGLYIGGWGTGQVITAGNVIAGRRYSTHRGSALALLNFTWSFGAMLSPLLAAWLVPHFALPRLLCGFAALHALTLTGILMELRGTPAEIVSASDLGPGIASQSRLTLRPYIYFAALLFFYGGVETCLAGWLTTFALRYGDRTLVLSEYTTLVLWASLTLGRAISSALLLRLRESTLQRAASHSLPPASLASPPRTAQSSSRPSPSSSVSASRHSFPRPSPSSWATSHPLARRASCSASRDSAQRFCPRSWGSSQPVQARSNWRSAYRLPLPSSCSQWRSSRPPRPPDLGAPTSRFRDVGMHSGHRSRHLGRPEFPLSQSV